MSLTGRTALVTGFGGGMGSALAVSLAEAGCRIVGTDRILSDTVKQNMEKIKEISGQDALFFECDLLNRKSIDHLCSTIASKVPSGIDILVNNAGCFERCAMDEKTPQSWDRELAINLTAPFLLSKNFAISMKKKGWGRIINMSSVVGLLSYPLTIGYCASKTGLVGLTKAIASELAPHGVTCNAICPYFVDTPIIQPVLDALKRETGASREESMENIRNTFPTKKFTTTKQIGDYVVFLCSPAADNMTGLTTPMDGGYSIV
ncbi:D-beta-hydroxybutyrate dehydrogenase isoform X5 [Magallana gigas]|uniref:D-beta-hydroxybutyrate dehydrogenase isoform X5 n=1 Tax=Magallana gigas TaxID=29159 RepID=UPI003340290C